MGGHAEALCFVAAPLGHVIARSVCVQRSAPHVARRSQRAVLGRLLDTTHNCHCAQLTERLLRSGLVETRNSNYLSPDAISGGNLESAIALEPVLSRVRALLSRSWSPDTAYPESFIESRWFAGNPQGQCGVSSVWLAELLAREYSIYSTFCQ